VIPREAGTLCAFGMAVTDIRHDYVAPGHQLSSEFDTAAVLAILERLRTQASADLRRQGFEEGECALEYSADARYPSQLFEITIPLPAPAAPDGYAAEIERAFHREHARLYTFHQDMPVEILHWRVTAIGRAATATSMGRADGAAAPVTADGAAAAVTADGAAAAVTADGAAAPRAAAAGSRDGYFDGWVEMAIHDGVALGPGATVAGPAVIESATTTILVPPGDRLTVAASGNFAIAVATG
jgi:N-methylhydantoinase A